MLINSSLLFRHIITLSACECDAALASSSDIILKIAVFVFLSLVSINSSVSNIILGFSLGAMCLHRFFTDANSPKFSRRFGIRFSAMSCVCFAACDTSCFISLITVGISDCDILPSSIMLMYVFIDESIAPSPCCTSLAYFRLSRSSVSTMVLSICFSMSLRSEISRTTAIIEYLSFVLNLPACISTGIVVLFLLLRYVSKY